VESSGDATTAYTLAGIIQIWNRGAQAIFGTPPKKPSGTTCLCWSCPMNSICRTFVWRPSSNPPTMQSFGNTQSGAIVSWDSAAQKNVWVSCRGGHREGHFHSDTGGALGRKAAGTGHGEQRRERLTKRGIGSLRSTIGENGCAKRPVLWLRRWDQLMSSESRNFPGNAGILAWIVVDCKVKVRPDWPFHLVTANPRAAYLSVGRNNPDRRGLSGESQAHRSSAPE
jgi:hypothetical protein